MINLPAEIIVKILENEESATEILKNRFISTAFAFLILRNYNRLARTPFTVRVFLDKNLIEFESLDGSEQKIYTVIFELNIIFEIFLGVFK